MSKFNVGDRVVIDGFNGLDHYLKNGMAGTVTVVKDMKHYGQTYLVACDDQSVAFDAQINEKYLKLEREKIKTVCIVEGPRGTIESLSEEAVQSLVFAGIVHHNRTNIFDDRVVKYYGTTAYRYAVTDKRSTYKSLEDQFPKDN